MAGSRFTSRKLRTVAAVILATAFGSTEAGVPGFGLPAWNELPQNKQQILLPLAGEWDALESWRKKKWLDIADKYPTMNQGEQERVQGRMKAWVKLTPEERQAARETYRNVQKASDVEREALRKMWSEYQSLPEEERQRFKAGGGKPVMQSGNGSMTSVAQ